MKTNIETMRYKVPKVKNRFVQTHAKLIVICAVILAVLVMLSFSYVLIRQSYVLEPKTTILLFCKVDDYNEIQSKTDKYSELFNIYFVEYVDDFTNENGKYDFSRFGSTVNLDYSLNKDYGLLAFVFPSRGYGTLKFYFKDVELADNTILDDNGVEAVIAKIRSSL